ncbi:MAG TPA: hypothetical protein VMR98_05260, partial [Candidatus Polarisedimenticolaceae bacterium]|nr:hypothetical protein [Candidatus Polarisedimenticolaceae bacterium]
SVGLASVADAGSIVLPPDQQVALASPYTTVDGQPALDTYNWRVQLNMLGNRDKQPRVIPEDVTLTTKGIRLWNNCPRLAPGEPGVSIIKGRIRKTQICGSNATVRDGMASVLRAKTILRYYSDAAAAFAQQKVSYPFYLRINVKRVTVKYGLGPVRSIEAVDATARVCFRSRSRSCLYLTNLPAPSVG